MNKTLIFPIWTLALVAGCSLVQAKSTPDANAAKTVIEVEAKFVELSEDAMKRITPPTSGTLTEQQMQTLFQKLLTADSVDILSAPKVTTTSGKPASIQVVQEMIYPTDWEKDPKTAAWTPKVVETNHVGVTFGVMATAKANGEIEMNLEPKIVALLGYIDLDDNGKKLPCTRDETIKLPAGHRMKRVFSTRAIKTSVVTKPGQTLVLGGFKEVSAFTQAPSEKRQLLVFVTARLVTPDSPEKPQAASKASEQSVSKKLKTIVIPEINFRPPATLVDAIDFLKQASRDYDDPELPEERRGVNLFLKLPQKAAIPVIPALNVRFVSLSDALKLVCEVTGMKFRVSGNVVIVEVNVPLKENP